MSGNLVNGLDSNSTIISTSGISESSDLPGIPLEDCVCPICLDNFIDVVQTRCQHRFCSFCLDNWLRVSFRRQCPTCRRAIGYRIQSLPELQARIETAIGPELDEDAIQERHRVRTERQSIMAQHVNERQETNSLLSRLYGHPDDNGQPDSSGGGVVPIPGHDLITRHILNWWDHNVHSPEGPRLVNMNYSVLNTPDIEDVPAPPGGVLYNYVRSRRNRNTDRQRRLPVARNRSRTRDAAHLDPNTAPPPAGRTSTSNRINAMSEIESLYQENLMEEYNYHMGRVNAAYTRIREGYRDFNYHNGRLQQIFEEFRIFFGREPPEMDLSEANLVDYEDYEGLVRAEIGELLDNSPAARILSGVPPVEALSNELPSIGRGGGGTTFFNTGNRLRNPVYRRRNRGRMDPNRHRGDNIFAERIPLVNVLDMEQEIETRRLLSDIMNLNRPRSPVIAHQAPFIPGNSGPGENLTRNLQQQVWREQTSTPGERVGDNESSIAARRIRRRTATVNILGENDNEHGVGPLSAYRREWNTRRSTMIPPGSPVGYLASTEDTASPIQIPARHTDATQNRRTISARRRLLTVANNSSSESESDQIIESYRRFSNRIRSIVRPERSRLGLARPVSAPENDNACRSIPLAQQHPHNPTSLAVTTSPSSGTRLEGNNALQAENGGELYSPSSDTASAGGSEIQGGCDGGAVHSGSAPEANHNSVSNATGGVRNSNEAQQRYAGNIPARLKAEYVHCRCHKPQPEP